MDISANLQRFLPAIGKHLGIISRESAQIIQNPLLCTLKLPLGIVQHNETLPQISQQTFQTMFCKSEVVIMTDAITNEQACGCFGDCR